ncbi:hypothetical protein LJB98_01525 [Bacteroidales bacterium OttesenSCG-928-M11]|nr:hypothetical protein [Bacteroidales bacterium OttesenSCG-928-M11]
MDRIKDLLERYWQCETSIEEEKELQSFFLDKNIPEDLSSYHELASWKKKTSTEKLEKRFQFPKKKIEFYPLLRAVAVVLLFLTFGIGFYTRYEQEKKIDLIFSESFTEMPETTKDPEEIVAKASALLLLIEEQNGLKADSLETQE